MSTTFVVTIDILSCGHLSHFFSWILNKLFTPQGFAAFPFTLLSISRKAEEQLFSNDINTAHTVREVILSKLWKNQMD